MKEKRSKKLGISLTVLIIVIIVMITLAGVVIVTLNNQIIENTKEMKIKNDEESIREAATSAYMEWTVLKRTNKEIGSAEEYVYAKLINQGLESDMLDLIEVTNSGKIGIYAKAPIPNGFTASIYEGETKEKEGLVIYQTDSLEGISQDVAMKTYNQFVWVPAKVSDIKIRDGYSKGEYQTFVSSGQSTEPYSYNTSITETNDLTGEYAEYKAMKESVEKYGGFYVGRYESGSETERKENVSNGTTNMGIKKDMWLYNYSCWGPSNTSVVGDSIDTNGYNQGLGAVELSRNLCKNIDGVESHLIYGGQWDAMLKFVEDDEHSIINSSAWGNYSNNEYHSSVSPNFPAKTGAHESWNSKNIYDIAGNAFDRTMEAYISYQRVFRGGICSTTGLSAPVSDRLSNRTNFSYKAYVFRCAMYVI